SPGFLAFTGPKREREAYSMRITRLEVHLQMFMRDENMKKVLLATSALVAWAGVASAQGVALSGSAEMGIVGGDRTGPDAFEGVDTDEINFFNDVDVRFTLSGETDFGLTFGAVVDLDEAGNLGAEADNQGTSVFLSGAFGTVTLGDTDGALDRVMQDASTAGNPGSITDDETVHAGYVGAFGDGLVDDNQILAYEYSLDNFLFAVSVEQNTGANPVLEPGDTGDFGFALGVRYTDTFGAVDITAGLGYQVIQLAAFDTEIIGVSVLAEIGDFSGVIGYTDWENFSVPTGPSAADDDSHAYIGLGYSFDAFSIHANYGEFDSGDSGFGLAAGYDLGGASILLGYGSSDRAGGGADNDFWSLGVSMSF
ncbi:MAG: porin, partial [Pseudomonadota bacterium]